MFNKHTLTLALFPWLIFFADASLAGSSMRSSGEGFASVGLTMDMGTRLFDKQANRISGSACEPGQSLSLYGEYGWSYYTTISAAGSARRQSCNADDQWALEGARIGINRRVDSASNAWVWEAGLLLPSQRTGSQTSQRDAFGLEAGLHYHPRPDPYDLSLPVSPLDSVWNAGLGVRVWLGDRPQEFWAYGEYILPLLQTDWNLGQGGWAASMRMDCTSSLGNTRSTTPFAVDSNDRFWRLDAGLSLRHPLSKDSAFKIGLKTSLAGQNTDDASAIHIQYEKTFPK